MVEAAGIEPSGVEGYRVKAWSFRPPEPVLFGAIFQWIFQ